MLIHLSGGLLPPLPFPCSSRGKGEGELGGGGKKQGKDVCKAFWEKKAIYRRAEARGHEREMQRVSQGPLGGGGPLAPSCRNPMGRLSDRIGGADVRALLWYTCLSFKNSVCSTSCLVTSD